MGKVSPAVANCENLWKDVTEKIDGTKLFEGNYERSLEGLETFQSHIVASGREGGIPRLWIIPPTAATDTDDDNAIDVAVVDRMEMLTFEENAHDVGLLTLRIRYRYDCCFVCFHDHTTIHYRNRFEG